MMAMTTEKPNEENIKCVIVGDNNVGKTRLICARAYKQYSPNNQYAKYGATHVPTVWANDHYRNDADVLEKASDCIDGVNVSLRMWDTFGDHSKNRKFSYGRADVVIICFSVCDRKSLEHVKMFWLPEARHHCKGVPVLLVGCKIDLRFANLEDLNKQKTSLAKRIYSRDILYPEICRQTASDSGCPYYETSICKGFGVEELFENAIRAALLCRRKMYLYRNLQLKHVHKPLLQKPLLPPKPDAPVFLTDIPETSLDFSTLHDDPTYSDVLILGNNFKFHAHKVVLAFSSKVFHKLFSTQSNSIYMVSLSNNESTFATEDKEDHLQRVPDLLPLQEGIDPEKSEGMKTHMDDGPTDHDTTEFDFVSSYSTRNNRNTLLPCDVLEVSSDVSWFSLSNVMYFCYKGHLDPEIAKQKSWRLEDIMELFRTCQTLGMNDLSNLLNSALKGKSETYFSLKKLNLERKNAIRKLVLWKKQYSDIEFKADDGTVPGHKALLVSGSDVMCAMFGSAFVENESRVVPFPDSTVTSLQTVFEFIYTGTITSQGNSILEYKDVIALANRLCLPDLITIVEVHIINDFVRKSSEVELTRDFHEGVIFMLEVAQLHNAHRVAKWCIHHIVTNYNDVCKKCKMIKELSKENRALLEKCRWPPVWFIKDYDYYERACKKRTLDESESRGKGTKK